METLTPPSAPAEATAAERVRRVTRASAWTIGSMGAMSLLRLGSQMLLTYLLLPEHFGAVALMRTFLVLLEMVSDVGIRGSVVYHAEGEKRGFLDTAWTLQILRGFLMWAAACALAWPFRSRRR